ncbi:hypothetical protein RND81_11G135900 [Saponaria officinalis]|uniref:WRKY domain-containing protein n=1 Tax=Saponaria officinalis TaxID=3572 RepID=A0AAW1HLL6_SAPOF
MECASFDRSRGVDTLSLFDDSPVRQVKNEAGVLQGELNKINEENARLTKMLMVVCGNYSELKRQLTDYMNSSGTNIVTKKRKVENVTNNYNNNNIVESSSSEGEQINKTKTTRVAIQTETSDSSMTFKDGYQWRKYGQKVTRDNPCPRAYFKCSFAPSCPVKKKVQRSLEDQTVLVATYEGEHNHASPIPQSNSILTAASAVSLVPYNPTLRLSSPTVTLDLTKPKSNLAIESTKTSTNTYNQSIKFNSDEFQKLLAQQMASSLTKDPAFTSALAAAISGQFF